MARIASLLVCALAVTFNASRAFPERENQRFASAVNLFAVDIYQKTIEGKEGNVIISPASIHSALTMASFGASEGSATRNQMLSGLNYPTQSSAESIAAGYKKFNENVENTNGLEIANKIFVMKNYSVKRSFQDIAIEAFKSEAQAIDFAESQQAADTINQWVEDHTNNKIKNLIYKDSLNADTRMVLVSTIHFKGFWKYPFANYNTHKAPFFLDEENSVDVDFMTTTKFLKHGSIRSLDAQAIELPYNDSDIRMMIILPNNRNGLAALERKLGRVNLGQVSKYLYLENVEATIPKFKIEFEIKLNEPLKKMGMTKMFSHEAEFGGLLEESEPLQISEVVHKAFIEVNEEGTEATGATDSDWALISMPSEFHANHPFLFCIIKESQYLFLGRVVRF